VHGVPIAETSRTQSALFDMQIRNFGPYLTALDTRSNNCSQVYEAAVVALESQVAGHMEGTVASRQAWPQLPAQAKPPAIRAEVLLERGQAGSVCLSVYLSSPTAAFGSL
jgi:hypothetical protein